MVEELELINSQDLLDMVLEPTEFLVEELLGPGLVVLVGDPKVGKSWFALDLSSCVSTGREFLRHATQKAGVVYMSLEDPKPRVQARLQRIVDEGNPLFDISIKARQIDKGLIEQIEKCVLKRPEKKLIIIDTLQKVRSPTSGNAYAVDYHDLGLLKECADGMGLCILLVHHTNKTSDNANPFSRISGSNGIMGVADEVMMLTRSNMMEGTATLTITGRDVIASEYTLELRDCKWELVSQTTEEELQERVVPPVVIETVKFIESLDIDWEGTATQLISAAKLGDAKPNTLTKLLNQYSDFLEERGVKYGFRRTPKARLINLTRIESAEGPDA